MRSKHGLLVLVSRVPCWVLERNQAALLLLFGTVLYEHAMVVATCICFQQRRCVSSFGNMRCLFGLDALEYLCTCTYMPSRYSIFLYAELLWVSFTAALHSSGMSGFFNIFFTRLGGIFYIIFQWAIWSDRIR
jgi:hypothetical protein